MISKPPDNRLENLKDVGLTKEQYIELTDETLRDDLLRDLKFSGIPKPPLVSDQHWHGVPKRHLSPRRKQAIYMAAMGKPMLHIAEELDYAYNALVKFLNEPDVAQMVAHKQEMIFQNNAKGRIKTMMNDAYGVVEYILKDPQEKSAVRLDAAKYVIDHVVGKSTQAIEIKGNLLGDFLTQLDQAAKMVSDDVRLPKVEESREVIDVVATAPVAIAAPVAEERPDMDNLVSQIVKTDFVVGKRS